ncbi:GNAT family N-acetyltransferase [Bacillus infantis]|uniref:GNAT family N-acetyltransferase n=1 Tax=Bacillus infantis TaxID=324767 RepID=UPI003CF169B9
MAGIDAAFSAEFPIIETERLLLRKPEEDDIPKLYRIFSNPEATRFYDVEPFRSVSEAEDLLESLLWRYSMKKQIRWAICWKEDNTLQGTCGFHSVEKFHNKAEIGYELHPEAWGKGIMSEAVDAIIRYGFNCMNLNRIEAVYLPENAASKKLLEKKGFKIEGLLRKRFVHRGVYKDAVISALLQEEDTKRILEGCNL